MTSEAETIEIFMMPGRTMDIVPAPVGRDWMDNSPKRFAYRCLPLNIANAYGWQILCPSRFSERWNGAEGLDALRFRHTEPRDPPAISHFGLGIVTFHVFALIRTPPGVSIFATGPVNHLKTGISALSGIVETDWLPFTFSMNWKMEAVDQWVVFEKGEPFCMFFPVRLDDIEAFDVQIKTLDDDPAFKARVEAFTRSRSAFLKDLQDGKADVTEQEWQKTYFRGIGAQRDVVRHRTSVKLSRPRKKTGK